MTPSFRYGRWLAPIALALSLGCQATLPTSTPGLSLSVENAPVSQQSTSELTNGLPSSQASYQPDELIIAVSPGTAPESVLSLAAGRLSLLGQARFSNDYLRVRLPSGMTLLEADRQLRANPAVRSVSLNWKVTPRYSAAPNDTRFSEQWSYQATEAPRAWQTLGSSFKADKVIVAVLDTGVDVGHPDLVDRMVPGSVNYTSDNPTVTQTPGGPNLTALPDEALSSDVTDEVGHGTHVAGIIAATGNNTTGITGLAWDARLLAVKVLGVEGGSTFGILQGIQYCVDYNSESNANRPAGAYVRVINMSLGSPYHGTSAAYEDAFRAARAAGILTVVAAGNEGSEVAAPANNDTCVSVSSTNHAMVGTQLVEFLSGFSNRGDRIDLAAPGGEILSTLPRYENQIGQTYGSIGGTSMAAPFVAGVAALVYAKYDPTNANRTGAYHDQIKRHLTHPGSVDDLGAPGKDPSFGVGRTNVYKAIAPLFLRN